MIPPALLLGLAAGLHVVGTQGRFQRWLVASAAIVAAVAWGVIVGVGDRSLGTFAGGAALAVANIAVGALVGAVIDLCLRSLRRRRRRASARP
jgi:hypothetical protein